MPFWRRRDKPLHERLAEGSGLLEWPSGYAPVVPPSFAGTLDVLHGGKPRQWDAVGTAEAPGLPGDAIEFTALPDGTLLVDEELPEDLRDVYRGLGLDLAYRPAPRQTRHPGSARAQRGRDAARLALRRHP